MLHRRCVNQMLNSHKKKEELAVSTHVYIFLSFTLHPPASSEDFIDSQLLSVETCSTKTCLYRHNGHTGEFQKYLASSVTEQE